MWVDIGADVQIQSVETRNHWTAARIETQLHPFRYDLLVRTDRGIQCPRPGAKLTTFAP